MFYAQQSTLNEVIKPHAQVPKKTRMLRLRSSLFLVTLLLKWEENGNENASVKKCCVIKYKILLKTPEQQNNKYRLCLYIHQKNRKNKSHDLQPQTAFLWTRILKRKSTIRMVDDKLRAGFTVILSHLRLMMLQHDSRCFIWNEDFSTLVVSLESLTGCLCKSRISHIIRHVSMATEEDHKISDWPRDLLAWQNNIPHTIAPFSYLSHFLENKR